MSVRMSLADYITKQKADLDAFERDYRRQYQEKPETLVSPDSLEYEHYWQYCAEFLVKEKV